MFTQCPHCLTLFRITPEHLKVAEGQVRCCQCNQTFNALLTLQEAPAPFSNSEMAPEEVGNDAHDKHNYHTPPQNSPESILINDSEVERTLDELADDSSHISSFSVDSNLESDNQNLLDDDYDQFLYEKDDGLETEPDYYAADTESQMSELLDTDSASLLIENENAHPSLAKIIELDIPELEHEPVHDNEPEHDDEPKHDNTQDYDDFLESLDSDSNDLESDTSTENNNPTTDIPLAYQASEILFVDDQPEKELPFTFEEEKEEKASASNTLLWTLGALLLLIPLSGQLAWQFRDSLIQHESGRQILNVVCSVAGCTTPIRIALEKILVTKRSLVAHPEKENTLSMSLEMVNTAPFQQPFPKLQLSLYNDMGAIIAQRTFAKSEYRPNSPDPDEMMPKLKPILIELELVDPGDEVTGFKFEFL